MMTFSHETYICLDIPEPQAQWILDIRKQQKDEFRAALPAEITVAGSSGVGVIKADQKPESVIRFPRTDIFVLTLEDEAPLRSLHQRIITSAISFETNRFPFQPHCTLHSRSPVSPEDAAHLLSLSPSDLGSFTLDTLSVYTLEHLPMTLLYRANLTGAC